jgi:hypothetical protein
MKYKLLAVCLAITSSLWASPSHADVYVIVDENGVAQSGAIVCDYATCGDPNSLYAQLTLAPGQRYVLQGTGSVGVGNNTPNTQVRVDSTNTWTATHTDPVTAVSTTTILNDSPATLEVAPRPIVAIPPVADTSTVTSDTATVTSDTSTATVSSVDVEDFSSLKWMLEFILAHFPAFLAYLQSVRG